MPPLINCGVHDPFSRKNISPPMTLNRGLYLAGGALFPAPISYPVNSSRPFDEWSGSNTRMPGKKGPIAEYSANVGAVTHSAAA